MGSNTTPEEHGKRKRMSAMVLRSGKEVKRGRIWPAFVSRRMMSQTSHDLSGYHPVDIPLGKKGEEPGNAPKGVQGMRGIGLRSGHLHPTSVSLSIALLVLSE